MKALDRLAEMDFAVLRGPFESGRQSPKSMGGTLLLSVPFQILLLFVTYIIAADHTDFPFLSITAIIHVPVSLVLIILAIIYGIPKVFRTRQIMQYVVVVLVSCNMFGISMYLAAIFLTWSGRPLEQDKPILLAFFIITLLLGVVVFISTWIRFLRLLKQGKYRLGTKRASLRGYWEAKTKKILYPAVVIGTSLILLTRSFTRRLGLDIEMLLIIGIGVLLFYVMLFILPEQMVLIYCKKRFKSFNFDEEGNLHPFESGDKVS